MHLIDGLQEEINNVIHDGLICHLNVAVRGANLGIDQRAVPSMIWYSAELLVVKTSAVKSLDYYGGFEYVEEEHRETLGEYTVFSGESERVQEVLDYLNNHG